VSEKVSIRSSVRGEKLRTVYSSTRGGEKILTDACPSAEDAAEPLHHLEHRVKKVKPSKKDSSRPCRPASGVHLLTTTGDNVFIYCDTIEQLTEIVAGLVKQGLTFSAQMQQHSAGWKITLTGGY
jgi:hypothetical protein